MHGNIYSEWIFALDAIIDRIKFLIGDDINGG